MTKPDPATNLPAPFFQSGFVTPNMSSTLLEEALKKIPNQQLLVNVVSKRVRQLSQGHRPMIDSGPRMGLSDIALREIIEGKLVYEMVTAATANEE